MSNVEEEESLQIEKIQKMLLGAFDGKILIRDWCALHRKSNITNINDKIFPLTDCSFYRDVAKFLISMDNKIVMTLPDDMNESRSNMTYYPMLESQCFDSIKGTLWEQKIIDSLEKRINITNEQAFHDLQSEIESDIAHDLFWLLSWSLRLTFVTSSEEWKNWMINENLDTINTARMLYYTHAYKDKTLFDLMIRYMFTNISQKIMSWDVLNNTFLTKKSLAPNIPNIRDIVVRMFPWPHCSTPVTHGLTEIDILELWSCGIFPLGTMLRGMDDVDSFPMSGPMMWMHDWNHTASHISSSMIFLSKYKFDQLLIDQIIESMLFWWNQYNALLINMIGQINIDQDQFWEKNKIHIAFLFVHEHFGSAMEKCNWIMEREMERILHLNKVQTDFRHDMTPKSSNIYKNNPLQYGEVFEFADHLNKLMTRLLSYSGTYPKNLMNIQTCTFLFNKLEMNPKSVHDNMIFCNSPHQSPCDKIKITKMPPLWYHTNNHLHGLLFPLTFTTDSHKIEENHTFFEIELVPYTHEIMKWKSNKRKNI